MIFHYFFLKSAKSLINKVKIENPLKIDVTVKEINNLFISRNPKINPVNAKV